MNGLYRYNSQRTVYTKLTRCACDKSNKSVKRVYGESLDAALCR